MTGNENRSRDPEPYGTVEAALRRALATGPDPRTRALIDSRVQTAIEERATEPIGRSDRQVELHRRRRLHRPGRMPVLMAAALIVVVAGSAVAAAPLFLSKSGEANEANQEAARLSWPGGAPPSFGQLTVKCPPDFASQTCEVGFEAGFGQDRADLEWFCAWSKEWLTTRLVNESEAQRAVHELQKITTLHLWKDDPGDHERLLEAIRLAEAGDPAALEAQRTEWTCSS